MLKMYGHPEAHLYPLCMLWTEGRLVEHQINMQTVSQAILTQAAIDASLSKDGKKRFNKLIERLSSGP